MSKQVRWNYSVSKRLDESAERLATKYDIAKGDVVRRAIALLEAIEQEREAAEQRGEKFELLTKTTDEKDKQEHIVKLIFDAA